MNEQMQKLLSGISKKLDALILLNSIVNLSGNEKLNILKHSVGIKPTAKILGKDKSAFKKKLKNMEKNATEKQ